MRIYLHNHSKFDNTPYFPSLRQTYFSSGLVHKLIFSEEPGENDDWIILFGGDSFPTTHQYVNKCRRILVLMEHPAIWHPSNDLMSQVGIIICPFKINHPESTILIQHHAAVPWFYGMDFKTDQGLSHVPLLNNYLELQDLEKLRAPKKTKLISCVVSAKRISPGQAWRIDLAEALKHFFADEIDLWGFGWNPLSNKQNAIDPYKYSLVIENDFSENYWTEKLSDAILGRAIPIYAGASKVQNYFSGKIPQIKYANDLNLAIEQIKKIIDSDYDSQDLDINRSQILFEHNLFYMLNAVISTYST